MVVKIFSSLHLFSFRVTQNSYPKWPEKRIQSKHSGTQAWIHDTYSQEQIQTIRTRQQQPLPSASPKSSWLQPAIKFTKFSLSQPSRTNTVMRQKEKKICFLLIHQEKFSKYRPILTSSDPRSRKTACGLFFFHVCSATKEAKLILTFKRHKFNRETSGDLTCSSNGNFQLPFTIIFSNRFINWLFTSTYTTVLQIKSNYLIFFIICFYDGSYFLVWFWSILSNN